MAKIALKIFLLGFSLVLILPNQVSAESQITITSSPSSVKKLEEFNIDFSVSLEANTQYYIKVRIGETTSDLNKGETYNEATSTWLSDTSEWTSFSTITTGAEGNYSSNIKARAKDTAQEGTNKMTIRVRKVGTDSNTDSDPVNLQLTAAASTSYPSNIYLSEFMPNSAEGQEWVELYNDNDSLADLSGWKIDDIDGGSSPQHFNAQIPAKSYFIIYLDSAKLNNDGDSVRLIRPDDSVADIASYDSSQKGVSHAKQDDDWQQTTTPTPGSANQITTSSSESSSTTSSPSPTSKSTSTSTPKATSTVKSESQTKSYQTDVPNYDWESQENPTPEPSTISFVLGEKTEQKSNKKPPLAILFIFAGILFFIAAFFPQIKEKIQDFLEEHLQRQL